VDADGGCRRDAGEWYLHLFSADQPDLNWNHPDVRREFEDVLAFWFDRGAAGIRIDSAALLIKDAELPEVPEDPGPGEHPNTDRDEIHDVYRSWRQVADRYADPKALVGELWLPDVSASSGISGRTSSTPRSTSTSSAGRGIRPASANRSNSRSPPTPPSRRRRRGSSRTTTSPDR
jgi:hypothetical protein